MKKPYLSVVIPAFNEEQNIAKGALEQVEIYLQKQKYSWEVIVVDDGSTDSTAQMATNFSKGAKKFRVLKEQHRGKAGTVIAGMLASNGEIVLFTDMDQATPIDQLAKILPKFDDGYDIVIGSRSGRKGAPAVRKLMAYGFMMLRTIILRLPYKDTQCGFKAFKSKPAKAIFKRMEVYKKNEQIKGAAVTAGFDLEVLYIARKLGFKVAEVPVRWEHKGTFRVSPIKDSLLGLRDLIRVRLNALLGKYRV